MPNVAEQPDDVAGALRGLLAATPEDTAEVEQPVAEEPEQPIEATDAEPAVDAVPATDDIDSLKTRLAERDAEVTRYEERLKATSERSRQSLDSLNQQKMRLASQRDRARQVIQKALSAEGVDKVEAERVLSELQAGLNPQSANYAPLPEAQVVAEDDRAVDGNQWLNDRGLTQAESESLGAYIRSAQLTPREQRLAATDIYSFLTVVEPRWRESAAKVPATDATKAVQTVARVQKQAAKVASASLGVSTSKVGQSVPRQTSPRLSDERVGELIRVSLDDR